MKPRDLERHQAQHVISRLLIGDAAAEFRYHGLMFTVYRQVNGYDVITPHETRVIKSRSLHKNLAADVMAVCEELADARRCVDCNAVLTADNWQVATRRGTTYIRSYCKPCYKTRNKAAANKWRAQNWHDHLARQRERRRNRRGESTA